MKHHAYHIIVIAVILCVSIGMAIPEYFKAVEDSRPRHDTDGWRVSLPEKQGMDGESLENACRYLRKTDVTNFIVVRHGYIVMERYFRGQRPRDFSFAGAEANFLLSALTGIAIDDGQISDINRKVLEYYPEYDEKVHDDRVRDITIEHLLSMTSGYGELPEELLRSMDWIGGQLGLTLSCSPGESFSYSARSSYLLSGILTRATGMNALDMAREKIFKPLAVSNAVWHEGPENYSIGGDFLYMKPLDMAKLGYAYVKGGVWNGKQVIPAGWVQQSFKKHVYINGKNTGLEQADCTGYGYGLAVRSIKGFEAYTAEGSDTAPNICMIPSLDLVVVITSYPGVFKSSYSYSDLKHVLENYVIPSVKR